MEYICNCNRKFETQKSLNSHSRFCDKFEKKQKKVFTGYCECGKFFEKAQSLNAHYSRCKIRKNGAEILNDRGGGGWNIGLNKNTNESIRKGGETLSNRIKEGLVIPSFKGKFHSVESKRVLSIKRTEFLENNPNSNIAWFVVSNGERDIKVQGIWELTVAEWLNSLSIKWDRKRILFDDYRRYTPDFWLPEHNLYLEVKGFLRDSDVLKMRNVISETGIRIKILCKEQYVNLIELNLEDIPYFE